MKTASVVSYGAIDALGFMSSGAAPSMSTSSSNFSKMLDSNDYSQPIDVPGTNITRGFCVQNTTYPSNFPKKLTKTQRIGMLAAEAAIENCSRPLTGDIAVVFSTILNESETLGEIYQQLADNRRVAPRTIINRIPDMLPSHIATLYGFRGPAVSLFASCATGHASIDYAMRLLDDHDYVIVGGADAACFPTAIKYFDALGAMSNISCPFDNARSGFVMGEAAACMVLQKSADVAKTDQNSYATLYPVAQYNDAEHDTAPSSTNSGARAAMKKAMSYVPGVDIISAHATSTPVGDAAEYAICTELLRATPIYAPKSKIGHTMAAAGIIETIYAIESSGAMMIPHIQNLNEIEDPHLVLAVTNEFIRADRDVDVIRTLNNSFGFGGKCASQVIEVVV